MDSRSGQAPDLEMRVRTVRDSNRTRLVYTFHSPSGAVAFAHRELQGPTLQTSPEAYQASFTHRIEQLGRYNDVDGTPLQVAEIERKLAGLGREIWRDLFPLEVRLAYREIRRSVQSWMIISDEPWIPWELARPFDDSDPDDILDDDFLVYRFELTRWLSGDKIPAREIYLDPVAVLQTDPKLPQASRERDLLKSIIESKVGVTASYPRLASTRELLRFLESQESRLIHVIGHGTTSIQEPDDAGIPLPDGSSFRPSDLDGLILSRIRRNRPFVFLNTCWAGARGWSFSRLGGWAPRWVSLGGCGAFVAPMWPVRDQAALAFARAFYRAVEEGKTLGRAALEARRYLQATRPGDPSALAYTIYGSPGARFLFCPRPSGVEPPATGENPLPIEPRLTSLDEWPGEQRGFRGSRRWRVLSYAASAIVLALVMIVPRFLPPDSGVDADKPSSGPLVDPPKPPVQTQTPSEEPKKPVGTPTRPPATVTSSSLRLELGGGDRGSRDAFQKALLRHAERKAHPLWIVKVSLDAPVCSAFELDQLKQVSCQLSAVFHGAVGAQQVPSDSVSERSSQFTEESARRAVAEQLAEAVAARFSEVEWKKGEL
jgi:CHAT domain